MLHAHVHLFLQTVALMRLFVKFPCVFYLPKSMFKFFNAETTYKRNTSVIFDFDCHVCCVSWLQNYILK